MSKVENVDKLLRHEKDKRTELIWALSLQDYNAASIARIFGIVHRSTVLRIIRSRPRDWRAKWVKGGE